MVALFPSLGTNWQGMPSRTGLFLQPLVERVTWNTMSASVLFFLKVSSPEQGVLCVESNWIAGNVLPGENQDIFILLYF